MKGPPVKWQLQRAN